MKAQRTKGGLPAGSLPVQEIFGPVPQGEGAFMGRRSCFVRFGRCNLHCPPCDSKKTWDSSRYDLRETCPPRTVEDIVQSAAAHGAGSGLTILTGGEPLMWQRSTAWEQLLQDLPGEVHVETNATIAPSPVTTGRVAHFSVSPKIGRMGAADAQKKRLVPSVLEAFAELAQQGRATFKFVAADIGEADEAAEVVRAFHLPQDRVWVMPLGDDAATWAAAGADIADHVMQLGFNLSGRLHLTLGVR
ncbi:MULTISPECIES: 7-carboxy-7-deazaguanine synthase QueE [unclassified Streptomyces]|uniref:7-carboxy-7-deazaguanine synthase QueE n=1 Tax=unclassified Streptomyces TaxID=2593676 RepID=UPI002DDA658B|nr:7-carboxy-7-deazaguanine synthase QueE [Streptomyces sp. NBC_01237]WRZ77261.1 7-carboxy-7-deazaguanine synthase QueE [Streptomyces sp. NBC_01237]